jgi:hypothetical protein
MSAISSPGPARRRTLTPYVLLWLLMASLALAYLTFLGARPDIVAAWRAEAVDPQQALQETKQNVDRALADLDPLRQSVGEVKMEVASLKTGAEEAATRDKILLDKVEALEQTVTANAQAKAAPVAAANPVAPPAARKAPTKVEPLASATPAHQAPAKSAPPIETGSIEQNAKAAAPKPPQVGILLATGPSVDSLRLSWTILTDRNAEAVRGLQPRYVSSGKGEERTFGLVAGPVQTTDAAKALCKTIIEHGMACEVSVYKGTAF